MLKTNSEKVKANIKQYILDGFNPSDYEGYEHLENSTDYSAVCKAIYEVFSKEKPPVGAYANMNEAERFENWCRGLPGILYTCYYLHSACDELGEILEETESEKAKYTEDEACKMITNLMYREIVNNK